MNDVYFEIFGHTVNQYQLFALVAGSVCALMLPLIVVFAIQDIKNFHK